MRLATWLHHGVVRGGFVTEAGLHPLPDGMTVLEVVDLGLPAALDLGARMTAEPPTARLEDVRLLPPLVPPSVRDFAAFEQHVLGAIRSVTAAATVPEEWYEAPAFYFTNPHALVGAHDDVPIPPDCSRFDFELEVAAIISGDGASVSVAQADEHIFGYTIFNDWSARDVQSREMRVGLGPAKAKDTATTLGPWIVTRDELDPFLDPDGFLELELSVSLNGVVVGRDLLSHMAWTFPELVAQAARGTVVRSGDVIGSGTCGNGGCLAELWGTDGADHRPLAAGDVVEMSVAGIGTICNTVVAATEAPAIPPARRNRAVRADVTSVPLHPAAGGSPRIPARAPWRERPELAADVEDLRAHFASPDLCVATELCDRHPADDVAFVVVDDTVVADELTFGELQDRSRRLAQHLRTRGVGRGARVGVLMGKSRRLPIVLLALWRLGAVHVPLFTAFAPPAISSRLAGAGATLVIVDPDQRAKLDGIAVPQLLTDEDLDAVIEATDRLEIDVAVGSTGVFIELYTSGTTGTPKGVGVPAFAIAAFTSYMRYGVDVTSNDVFWNAADPGWAYGLYFGIVGPLAIGRPNILLTAGFSAALCGRVIDTLGVTNFAAAPTAYRAMRQEGVRLNHALRAASSAGEPLTPDVSTWARGALGCEVHDHWGQTEQGMAFTNAWAQLCRSDHKPGSMGTVLPGFAGGTVGQTIALDTENSPLMWFTGYMNAPQQTQERFTGDGRWYLTGDIGKHDGTHFFFASRDDDVILAAGYRIAPFDIETILAADPAVSEVAVVGRPDDIRGEVVEAFVVLDPHAEQDGLRVRLQTAVRNGYGAHAYPRAVYVVDRLPKTPSGKVQRFVLRGHPQDVVNDWKI